MYDITRQLPQTLIDLIKRQDNQNLFKPIVLGGTSGANGGTGGAPGGFTGRLPQTRVCFDTTEASSSGSTTSGSIPSLVDNLNRIRYDIRHIQQGWIPIDGGLSWTSGSLMSSGGTGLPAGSDTWIQYNNGGAFGASEQLAFTTGSGGMVLKVGSAGTPTGLTVWPGIFLLANDTLTSEFSFVSTSNNISPTIAGKRAYGTLSSMVAVPSDGVLLSVVGSGYDGGAWSGARARIRFSANENWATGKHGTAIDFYTTGSGGTSIALVATFNNSSGIKNVITNLYTTKDYALTAEMTGSVLVRSAEPNIVGGAFGATPGGARGQYAVDLQMTRGAAGQVASGLAAFIGAGYGNIASNNGAVVCGGYLNVASGIGSTVPGGYYNEAKGGYSFAAGRYSIIASAHNGVFQWADETSTNFNSMVANEFALRARGGFRHAYDDASYWKASISATGVCTFATLPVGAGFVFTPPVTFTAAPLFSTMSSSWMLYAGASGVLSGSANATLDASGNAKFAGQLNVGSATGSSAGVISSNSGGAHAAWKIASNAGYSAEIKFFEAASQKWHMGRQADNSYAFVESGIAVRLAIAPGGTTTLTGSMMVTGAFGCNGATAQASYAKGTLTAYSAGATGYANATIASELHASVVAIRAALVANGIMV